MTVRVVDPPDVGKGIVGAVSSVVGRIGGRNAVIARSLGSLRRGAMTHADGVRLAEAADQACALRIPFIFFVASSGADVLDGVAALHGWGRAAAAISRCSGIVPVVAVATGPVVSGPALLLGLADLVVMSSEAVAFVSGPQMVAEFTGVEIGLPELGGVATHARSSGLCAVESDDVDGAVAELLEYLPAHTDEMPPLRTMVDPVQRATPELREIIPDRKAATYDVREVIRAVADEGGLRELWPRWAGQVVTGLSRMGGIPVGFVASQPRILAGTLDIAASQKASRFVRFCDSFNLPLVTLVDTPGFLPGKDLEWRGMIRHGAELAFAYAQASVPRVCLILRKAFGGAYIVMDSRGVGNDVCLAWPAAEIAVMGASGAVQILHRGSEVGKRADREAAYEAAFLNPWPASERGLVDQVIDPAETRIMLCSVLRQLSTKRELVVGRKHDAGPQ
ncbi:MAG TPA: carboxyl transferase domain-containing protein [Acidimicrobiales bacterium]|nr:carboxyl transferase domain-containing protein [Acidimicrobiales bacterium]